MSFAAFAVDSGGVSEGVQVWAGKKVFLDNTPVSTTLAGHATLYHTSNGVQFYDCDGSHRNVTLPAVGLCEGFTFTIRNVTAVTYNLVVKNAAASTIATVGPSETGVFYCNGVTWVGYSLSNAAGGYMAAGGTTTGATAQTQTFTNGVTLDTVIGNTAAPLTVTAKAGATNTIGNAAAVAGGAGNGAFNGGAATVTGGASGAGATGNGGAVGVTGGAAASTAGTGGAVLSKGGLGTTTGAGGASTVEGGTGGATGSGGLATLKGGASAGAGGTAGAVNIDSGAATGGTGAGITIGTTNALSVTLGKTVWTPSAVQDVAGAGGTILIPTLTSTKRITATGSAGTGTILGVGTVDGQVITLLNVSANSVTFAAAGTSNVADGASSIMAALTANTYVWDATTTKWYHLK